MNKRIKRKIVKSIAKKTIQALDSKTGVKFNKVEERYLKKPEIPK